MATASSSIAKKPLVLESNHLIDCRTVEKCYCKLVAGHNVAYHRHVAKVEMKQHQVKEAETRREFDSTMSLMLGR